MANTSLKLAKKNKNDEFYTQLSDIENELKFYKEHFKDKIVYCNCDDPFESNFVKYFCMNFKRLKIKKLYATSYLNSTIADKELNLFNGDNQQGYFFEVNKMEDFNGDGFIDIEDAEHYLKYIKPPIKLNGRGDFSSDECIEILKESDIIVTNPPFSLFREYVAQLMKYDKKFLIIGNINALSYKEIFPLVKDNKMWLGKSIHSGDREFLVPDDYPLNASGFRVDDKGNKYIRVKGVRWFTNLEYKERHEDLQLFKTYKGNEYLYPKYDNYDAINVDKTADIPCDYYEPLGVPITFLDKYNPNQFEILDGIGRYSMLTGPTKKTRGTYLTQLNGKPKYARIIIKRKN